MNWSQLPNGLSLKVNLSLSRFGMTQLHLAGVSGVAKRTEL